MKRLLYILFGFAFLQISAIRFNDSSYGSGSETALIQTLDGYHTMRANRDVIVDTADDYDGFWGEPITDEYGSSSNTAPQEIIDDSNLVNTYNWNDSASLDGVISNDETINDGAL